MGDDKLSAGLRALRLGDRREARRIFVTLVREAPEDAAAWWNLALATEDSEQKAQCLRQVVRLRPDHKEARRLLAKVEQQIAKPTPARGISRPVLDVGDEMGDGELRVTSVQVDASGIPSHSPVPYFALVVMIGALLLAGTIAAVWIFNQLAGQTPKNTGRTINVSVQACVVTTDSPATLEFVNETGLSLTIYRGAVGQEVALGVLAPGAQQVVEAPSGEQVRYVMKADDPQNTSGGAVIAVPQGNTCRVSVR